MKQNKKKLFPAIMAIFMPCSGQFIKGDFWKGFFILFGWIAGWIIIGRISYRYFRNIWILIVFVFHYGMYSYQIYDAYNK